MLFNYAVIHLLLSLSFAQNNEAIINKTWFCSSGFAGYQLVIFNTNRSQLKAIRQVHGSGVCDVESEIYDVDIVGDTLYLDNGLNLMSGQASKSYRLIHHNKYQLKLDDESVLEVISNDPQIYNWATNDICDIIDLPKLSRIKIGKNEIYMKEIIINMQE